MHWFCPNNLNCCVSGTMRKYVVVRPSVPIVWLIQEGTDLIWKEVTTLEEVGFSFNCSCAWSLFGSQLFVQAIRMCLLWVFTTLCDWPTQVISPQLVVARRWDDLPFSKWHSNKPTIGRLTFYLPNALFSPLLMSLQLGMEEFIVFFQMTKNMMWLLEISLDIHVFILSKYW